MGLQTLFSCAYFVSLFNFLNFICIPKIPWWWGGTAWLTVLLPAPYFLCMLLGVYKLCLQQNTTTINFCFGATSWNISSGWPRGLHVDKIIENHSVEKLSFHVACMFCPASYTATISHQLSSIAAHWTDWRLLDQKRVAWQRTRRVQSWWRLRVSVCSMNTLLRAQSKRIMEM